MIFQGMKKGVGSIELTPLFLIITSGFFLL